MQLRTRLVRPHLLAPGALLAIGVAAAVMARGLSLGSLTEPAPGLWPLVVAILTAGAAALLLFVDKSSDYERWDSGVFRVAGGVAMLFAYVMLFQIFGFLVATALMVFAWLRLFGREGWIFSGVLAVGGAYGLTLLFANVFAVPFPEPLIALGVS